MFLQFSSFNRLGSPLEVLGWTLCGVCVCVCVWRSRPVAAINSLVKVNIVIVSVTYFSGRRVGCQFYGTVSYPFTTKVQCRHQTPSIDFRNELVILSPTQLENVN